MRKRILLFIPLLVFIILVVLFNAQMDTDPTQLDMARAGQPVPDFSLEALDEPTRTLNNADLPDQPYLINVWATWCPACRVEHPYLVDLKEKGINIVGLDYKDERDKAVAWLTDLGDPYSLVLFDKDGRLGLDLGVYGAPETYVVDSEGLLRYRHIGIVNEKVWQDILRPQLIEAGWKP
ncbi:DsbE family thiol:disulfide interchange protein [Allohahella marinimesophila]|uniref:DsbE family thiol:disulfide interchange protein n=1 Tax=Allohahella marinimesophila TaxID=1054972 RepID=UPI0031D05AD7